MKFLKNNLILFILISALGLNVCFGAQSAITGQISKMENSIWGFEYSQDDVSKRLSRIENNVFGKMNTNLSEKERINKLNEALGFESFEDSTKQAYELDKTEEVAGINYPQIDALENQMFQTTYEKENIYKRLERLEKKIFGSAQEGNLASRTDRLKSYVNKDAVASQNPSYHVQKPYTMTQDIEQYMGSQNKYENSDIYIQLAGLETS